jgi:hypothetical protein
MTMLDVIRFLIVAIPVGFLSVSSFRRSARLAELRQPSTKGGDLQALAKEIRALKWAVSESRRQLRPRGNLQRTR